MGNNLTSFNIYKVQLQAKNLKGELRSMFLVKRRIIFQIDQKVKCDKKDLDPM
jgi:hypothetical protein